MTATVSDSVRSASPDTAPDPLPDPARDDPAPVAEWLPYLAACLGARAPWRLPAWAGRLLAGESVVHMMTQNRGSSNAKARRELDWKLAYPSWRQGFASGLGLPASTPTATTPAAQAS